jgi:phage portal protein BeeE
MIDRLSRTGSMPLILYRRLPNGGKARDCDHPLGRLLHDQPDSWQTAFDFGRSGHTSFDAKAVAAEL